MVRCMTTYSRMYSFVWVTFSIISISAAAERDSTCVTPNGENATCIPIDSCLPIKRAIQYLNTDAVEFARNSQCGYDDSPLVCCGSTGRTSTISTTAKTTIKTTATTAKTTTKTTTKFTTTPALQNAATEAVPLIVRNNLLDQTSCGIQSDDVPITGGRKTVIREFPWMVSLKYAAYDGRFGGLRCTGTLINKRYVLTAAECLDIQGFDLVGVRLGKWNYSETHDCYIQAKNRIVCALPIDLTVDEEIPHPNYHKGNNDNNIALLRLTENVEYDEFIRPICLQPRNFLRPKLGTIMDTSGWNIHVTGSQWDVKLKGRACIINNKHCDALHPNFTHTHPNSACIEEDEESDLCIDNSGSPLMKLYKVNTGTEQILRWYQEGIVYKGLGCHPPHFPASYTRVSKHLDWILSNMRE